MAKPNLKLAIDNEPTGPSERFLGLTRNLKMARNAPKRFERSKQVREDDVWL